MNLKKTALITAAAGALGALAVPAMAFENEFHGTYGINATFSNFQAGTSGDYNLYGQAEKKEMNKYIEQRARLQYIAKANDDLKLVTHFEFDNRFGAGRSAGVGDLDTDFSNFELKHLFLDFNVGKAVNVKAGLLPYKDTIKGLFIDADAPAIYTSTKLGMYTLGVGFSRFDDDGAANLNGSSTLGDATKDVVMLDNTFAITKDVKAAFSYYFANIEATGSTGGVASAQGPLSIAAGQNIYLHTFGLSGEAKVGPATVSGFVAAQTGHQSQTDVHVHGWAANMAAKAAVGPGTAKAGFLFASGNNSTKAGSYKGWITSSVNTYNEGGMMILARNTANSPTSTDTFIRRNVTNIALATAGYDANLTKQLFVNGNVGCGWVPASGAVAGDFMGIEANLEAGYKLYDNLTLKAAAGYLFAGGYYSKSTAGDDPENPYTMRLHAQFKF